jgi:hypothetical protein
MKLGRKAKRTAATYLIGVVTLFTMQRIAASGITKIGR